MPVKAVTIGRERGVPMMTATASSTRLPRRMKFLKPLMEVLLSEGPAVARGGPDVVGSTLAAPDRDRRSNCGGAAPLTSPAAVPRHVPTTTSRTAVRRRPGCRRVRRWGVATTGHVLDGRLRCAARPCRGRRPPGSTSVARRAAASPVPASGTRTGTAVVGPGSAPRPAHGPTTRGAGQRLAAADSGAASARPRTRRGSVTAPAGARSWR